MNTNEQFNKEMQATYEYVLKQIGGEQYGMTNVFEFMAEALSNKDFQETLNRIPARKGTATVFEKIVNSIKDAMEKVLGRSVEGSVLGEVLDMVDIASKQAISAKLHLNSISLDSYDIFNNISEQGNYEGKQDDLRVAAWAQKNGIFYSEGEFYANSTKKSKLDKDTIIAISDDSVDNFYYRTVLKDNATISEYIKVREDTEAIPSVKS